MPRRPFGHTEAHLSDEAGLLEDPERAQRMGAAAKQRVRSDFLGARSLIDYLGLISRLLA